MYEIGLLLLLFLLLFLMVLLLLLLKYLHKIADKFSAMFFRLYGLFRKKQTFFLFTTSAKMLTNDSTKRKKLQKIYVETYSLNKSNQISDRWDME